MATAAGAAPEPIRAEDIATHPHFRRLHALPGIDVDLRYAGPRNFAGRDLYGALDCAWLRREAVDGLIAAAAALRAAAPGWRLRVLDALRPHRVQLSIWADVAGTPAAAYFAPPEPGSIHSHGMAVDVTLLDADGIEADMGSGFDEMDRASHPALHPQLLAEGRLTAAQVQRRERLAHAMAAGGFQGIAHEWWHFDHGRRARVRRDCPRVW